MSGRSRRLRGKERDFLRQLLLDVESIFVELARQESNRVLAAMKILAKQNNSFVTFDEEILKQASDITGFRNASFAIQTLLADTFEEEFEAIHGLTVGEASNHFQEDLVKKMAAEAVAQGMSTLPTPDKDGLN